MPIHKVKGGWKWGSRGKVYRSRAGAERQARAAYANGYRGDGHIRLRMAQERRDAVDGDVKANFTLPPDHKPGLVVPQGGSSCASCRYLGADGESCRNHYFIEWNGSDRLPAPADQYCSDWWED